MAMKEWSNWARGCGGGGESHRGTNRGLTTNVSPCSPSGGRYTQAMHGRGPSHEEENRRLYLDNMRLWDCLAVFRSDPTMTCQGAINTIFSLDDRQYLREFPDTQQLLDIRYSGGATQYGNDYDAESENVRLKEENSRLHAAVWVLRDNPTLQADSTVAAIFRLTDSQFQRKFYAAAYMSDTGSIMSGNYRAEPIRHGRNNNKKKVKALKTKLDVGAKRSTIHLIKKPIAPKKLDRAKSMSTNRRQSLTRTNSGSSISTSRRRSESAETFQDFSTNRKPSTIEMQDSTHALSPERHHSGTTKGNYSPKDGINSQYHGKSQRDTDRFRPGERSTSKGSRKKASSRNSTSLVWSRSDTEHTPSTVRRRSSMIRNRSASKSASRPTKCVSFEDPPSRFRHSPPMVGPRSPPMVGPRSPSIKKGKSFKDRIRSILDTPISTVRSADDNNRDGWQDDGMRDAVKYSRRRQEREFPYAEKRRPSSCRSPGRAHTNDINIASRAKRSQNRPMSLDRKGKQDNSACIGSHRSSRARGLVSRCPADQDDDDDDETNDDGGDDETDFRRPYFPLPLQKNRKAASLRVPNLRREPSKRHTRSALLSPGVSQSRLRDPPEDRRVDELSDSLQKSELLNRNCNRNPQSSDESVSKRVGTCVTRSLKSAATGKACRAQFLCNDQSRGNPRECVGNYHFSKKTSLPEKAAEEFSKHNIRKTGTAVGADQRNLHRADGNSDHLMGIDVCPVGTNKVNKNTNHDMPVKQGETLKKIVKFSLNALGDETDINSSRSAKNINQSKATYVTSDMEVDDLNQSKMISLASEVDTLRNIRSKSKSSQEWTKSRHHNAQSRQSAFLHSTPSKDCSNLETTLQTDPATGNIKHHKRVPPEGLSEFMSATVKTSKVGRKVNRVKKPSSIETCTNRSVERTSILKQISSEIGGSERLRMSHIRDVIVPIPHGRRRSRRPRSAGVREFQAIRQANLKHAAEFKSKKEASHMPASVLNLQTQRKDAGSTVRVSLQESQRGASLSFAEVDRSDFSMVQGHKVDRSDLSMVQGHKVDRSDFSMVPSQRNASRTRKSKKGSISSKSKDSDVSVFGETPEVYMSTMPAPPRAPRHKAYPIRTYITAKHFTDRHQRIVPVHAPAMRRGVSTTFSYSREISPSMALLLDEDYQRWMAGRVRASDLGVHNATTSTFMNDPSSRSRQNTIMKESIDTWPRQHRPVHSIYQYFLSPGGRVAAQGKLKECNTPAKCGPKATQMKVLKTLGNTKYSQALAKMIERNAQCQKWKPYESIKVNNKRQTDGPSEKLRLVEEMVNTTADFVAYRRQLLSGKSRCSQLVAHNRRPSTDLSRGSLSLEHNKQHSVDQSRSSQLVEENERPSVESRSSLL